MKAVRVTALATLALPLCAGLAVSSCASGVRVESYGVGAGAAGGYIDCGKDLKLCGELCVDVQSDAGNCGDCKKSCAKGEACIAGKCGVNCGGKLEVCNGKCVDLQDDPAHCGKCETACKPPAGADPVCVAGQCASHCQDGFEDCDGDPKTGCEANLKTDPEHCASCDNACPAMDHASAACKDGKCVIGTCDQDFDDCDADASNGCEANLQKNPKNCGMCKKACNSANKEQCLNGMCQFVPFNFKILAQKDITYQGIDYLLLRVSFIGNTSAGPTWCDDYMNLCLSFGYLPTGCGQMYTNMNNGYGFCKTLYQSDGTSDTLGCNPSGGVANAAIQNGFSDANSYNSFGFHYCDAGTCSKTMCSGTYCSTSLSYVDLTEPYGYTLCKKP